MDGEGEGATESIEAYKKQHMRRWREIRSRWEV